MLQWTEATSLQHCDWLMSLHTEGRILQNIQHPQSCFTEIGMWWNIHESRCTTLCIVYQNAFLMSVIKSTPSHSASPNSSVLSYQRDEPGTGKGHGIATSCELGELSLGFRSIRLHCNLPQALVKYLKRPETALVVWHSNDFPYNVCQIFTTSK